MSRFIDSNASSNTLVPPIGAYFMENLVSLEESLKHLKSSMQELDRYIATAKQHCHLPCSYNLTKDESAAIYLYSMEAGDYSIYRMLNQALRAEDRKLLVPWFPYLKLIDTALNKLPNMEATIWRGIQIDVLPKMTQGQRIKWWGISSCSLDMNIIKSFLGPKSIVFMIEALYAKDVSAYTSFKKEKEFLLLPGTQLIVIDELTMSNDACQLIKLREMSNGKLHIF